MASLKAEKTPLNAAAGQAKKEPKPGGCCGSGPKATKQAATNKAEQKPRETKKKASGGKAVAKN